MLELSVIISHELPRSVPANFLSSPAAPIRSLVSPSAAFEESHYKSCSYNRFLTSATGHHATEIRGGILDATSHSIRPLPTRRYELPVMANG